MSSKAQITNVTVETKFNTAYVYYSSGVEKMYPADKLPKTVVKWLEEHEDKTTEEEPAAEVEATALEDEKEEPAADDPEMASDKVDVTLAAQTAPLTAPEVPVVQEHTKRRETAQKASVIPVPGGIPGSPLPLIQTGCLLIGAMACKLGAVMIRAVIRSVDLIAEWSRSLEGGAVIYG